MSAFSGPPTLVAKKEEQTTPPSTPSPPRTPSPSVPLKRGDRVIYRSKEYYFVPNGTSCYLYTDLASMLNHNPKVKNWQHSPQTDSVTPLRRGTRGTPGETPLGGRTKHRVSELLSQETNEHKTTASVSPEVTPAPASASAPTSAPALPATESATNTSQDKPLVSALTTAPVALAPRPATATTEHCVVPNYSTSTTAPASTLFPVPVETRNPNHYKLALEVFGDNKSLSSF